MANYCEQLIAADPALYQYAKSLTYRYGRGRAAFKLAKALSGLKAPNGEHYSLSNIKEALRHCAACNEEGV